MPCRSMWLLNTATYQLVQEPDPSQVDYAILSHVWHRDEQSFQDIQTIHALARESFETVPEDDDPKLLTFIRSRLSAKIRHCCDYARARGLQYAWIDTCCIDKTSSAELSEAINSMFDWYSHAMVCYVFMADVPHTENPELPGSAFRRSAWFTRGWTLQELIVPWGNVFLSMDWCMVGTKASLGTVIEDVTGIERDVLLRARPLHSVSVARRISWATSRKTTRVEDEAYCLMGLFGVRLPALYGEGRQAFVRLQEEIMKRIPDQSLLAWGYILPLKSLKTALPTLERVPIDQLRSSKGAYLFAHRPADFHKHSAAFSPLPLGSFARMLGLPSLDPPLYMPTSHGMRTTFPVATIRFPSAGRDGSGSGTDPDTGGVDVLLAVLSCCDVDGRLPALILAEQDASWKHIASGFDAEHGFLYTMDGFADEPLDGPLDTGCLRRGGTLTRAEWIRRARAADETHDQLRPRIALLDSEVLYSELFRSTLRVRDVCIPYQSLHIGPDSQSEMLTRRFPKRTGEGFSGPCDVILPAWTLEHLKLLNVDVDVEMRGGGMVPLPVRRSGDWDNKQGHHTLQLYDGPTAILVTMYMCPTAAARPFPPERPLHAWVSWHNASLYSGGGVDSENSGVPPRRCSGESEHVSTWTDGKKHFPNPLEDSSSVTLRFISLWDRDELSGVGLQDYLGYNLYKPPFYALEITYERSVPRNSTSADEYSG
ncbi:heterokaryon incompatibility protein-domain-containing protein [Trametes meyenii]|nr:heterokaryon incompatibility protein-domain-containing protein [Trametes meyenii]